VVYDSRRNAENKSRLGILPHLQIGWRRTTWPPTFDRLFRRTTIGSDSSPEEEYEQFKSQLLRQLQEEWPDATVTIDDDEDVYFETQASAARLKLDVRARIADIVKEVIDSGDWQEEEEDFFDDEEELGGIEEKDDY